MIFLILMHICFGDKLVIKNVRMASTVGESSNGPNKITNPDVSEHWTAQAEVGRSSHTTQFTVFLHLLGPH
jgi:hypothetical protein